MISKIKLVELAQKLGAKLYGNGDIIITGIASISNAKVGDITFLKDSRFRNKLNSCCASAVILSVDDLVFCRNIAALVVKDPYFAYVKIAMLMDTTPQLTIGVDPQSIINANAILGKNISIGANTVIESGVILDNNVIIEAGGFIGKNVQIGAGTRLCANVTIYHGVKIGKNCLIQSGAIIGSDGFGYFKKNNTWVKIPQLGSVKIKDNVEIGANTTIDRGSLDDTIIKNGVIIDNQCQIAHNVIIGEHTAIAGGVIMAGSLTIGRCCMIGGASVIKGHINICDEVTITGMSMVIKSIKCPGIYSSGIPIQPNIVWRKTATLVMRIGNIHKRIKTIEQKLKKILLLSFKK